MMIVLREETEDDDPGDPLSLDEIFSPHFAVRHLDSTWIEGNKRERLIAMSVTDTVICVEN